MKLNEIAATFSAQIPIIALDVLAPEELTILAYLSEEFLEKLDAPTFFWNIGTSNLERVLIAEDGGIIFQRVPEFKQPANTDPLLFVFDFIEGYAEKAIFVIGDIHPFIGRGQQYSVEVASKVKNLYHRLKHQGKRVVLLGNNIQLNESLIRLIPYCELPLPTVAQVLEHINSYLGFIGESAAQNDIELVVELSQIKMEELARALLGLSLEEISDYLRLTTRQKRVAQSITVNQEFITAAVEYKTRILAQMGIELGKPAEIEFGGLDLLRDWLQKRRRLFTQEARSLNLPRPKGVLLAGPPGTGKSLVAKNIAQILNLPLLQIDIASMLGSLVGESENNVRRALKTAEAIAPCVVWLDEVEKALSGSGDTSGVSQRILGSILTFMSESRAGVFVVATANDVSQLPSELKRKGRFDENFYVALPTETERAAILVKHLARFGCSGINEEYIEAIAQGTEKFSGAELETLAAEAALIAFEDERPQQVSIADLEAARITINPLAIQDAARIEIMESWAKTARPASSAMPVKTSTHRAARMRF
jgi:hypothetical protein